ncbi:ribose-phosphate diphosphokinase [Bacteroidota bacterium]
MSAYAPIKIFSGRSTKYLSEKITKSYGIKLGQVNVTCFSDGEFQPSFEETVRGDIVFIVQSTFPPTENLFELLFLIDAAKRASAYKIVAVIPYFGYGRQDRKDKPRVSIGSKLVSNLLKAAGVDRIMTMDLHADQIQGFFDIPVDHLYSSAVFVPYIKKLNLDNLVVASPDIGGSKRASAYAKFLETDMVICHKVRKEINKVKEMTIIGDIKGKNVVIVDDMVDTAGTVAKAADMMIAQGAKTVRCFATHPVLSGPAYERIEKSDITSLVVTDSIPLERKSDKIEVISISDLFAYVIKKVYNNESISSSFIN